MFTSTQPRPLKSKTPTNYNTITQKTGKGPYTIDTAYPFKHSNIRVKAKEEKLSDHRLSGAKELMELLDGQETIVKQSVVERIAKLSSAPYVHAVRAMIVQEIANHRA